MSMITKVWQWFESRQPTEHERAQDLFSDYLDGRLSPQATAWLEEHLQVCDATCPRDLEALRHTVQMVRQLPAVPPPRSFALSRAMLSPRPAPSLGWMPAYLPRATALAALLLVFLISGDLGLQFFYTSQAPTPAAAPAEELALEQAAPEETPAPLDKQAPPEGEAIGGELLATPEAEARVIEVAPPTSATHPLASLLRPLEALALAILLILGFTTAWTAWHHRAS